MSLNSSQKTICVEDSNGMQMCDETGGGGGGNSRVWKSPNTPLQKIYFFHFSELRQQEADRLPVRAVPCLCARLLHRADKVHLRGRGRKGVMVRFISK